MKAFIAWMSISLLLSSTLRAADGQADLILHSGKIVTVDQDFTIAQALAVKEGRIVAVGTDDEVLPLAGSRTELIDLQGKMVLPGLIDSHVHPVGASVTEFDHEIPEMESIEDVLRYIRSQASITPPGEWIVVRQVFITRLREQRYPTKAELDAAAPEHPMAFITGPDAAANSLALKLSGIDRNSKGSGILKDPRTGELTGILHGAGRLKMNPRDPKITGAERDDRLAQLFADYNRVGLTAVIDRSCDPNERTCFQRLHQQGRLTVRVRLSRFLDTSQNTNTIVEQIRSIAEEPLCQGDDLLRIIGVKAFLDGGMLTGSAYMQQPWGVSDIYGITDPAYRGVRNIPFEVLVPIIRTTVENGLAFTAHAVGDGAVQGLLDAYEEVNKTVPIGASRSTISHSNFMSAEDVERCARLKVAVDIQPAWLYLDTRTLVAQFGYDRLRYFQPLRSLFEVGAIAGGGSDDMQKIGSLRSVNPYNPWLGMWVAITRRARWYDGQLHPEEAVTREQAIRFYTISNAYIAKMDERIGSLEAHKIADFIIVDRDLLACPMDDIRRTHVLATYLGGQKIPPER